MAAKIKDGLFIGDAETSQSEVFINDNKISNLINLAGKEVPNIWSSHGLVYLTYNWEDRSDYRLFSGQDDTILTDIVEFVDVSIAHGISVLLFSKKGTGRCVIAACLYLMMKYRWGFEKSYDYVYSKKPDIDLNKGFIQQMFALDMKLLAARQKAYALKHGIENGFRIEPNMTINDIAAMLPPTEAKRWNSWDPNYILAPNNVTANDENGVGSNSGNEENNVTWLKYCDSVINALRKKDSLHSSKTLTNKQKVTFRVMDDAEEELVLIFSFINSKNTISSLPGPYHNIYDVHKNFKLRFDNVLFEEDINMFPSSPSNLRYGYIPRSILKGSRLKHSQLLQQQNNNNNNNSNNSHQNHRGNEYLMTGAEEKTNTMSSSRNSFEIIDNSSRISTTSTANNTTTTSDDLYRYVGLASESKLPDHPSAVKSREEKKAYPGESAGPDNMWSVEDDRKSGMSAEERLRKLMADMQRSNHFPDHLRSGEVSDYTASPRNASSNNNINTRSSYPPSQQQAKNEYSEDNYYSTASNSISLHELANMPVQASTAAASDPKADMYGRRGNGASHSNGRNHPDISMVDLERDENTSLKPSLSATDPLAAFDVPQKSKGPLKARHDLPVTANSMSKVGGVSAPNPTRNSMPKQAWNSAPTSSNGNNRPPSPNNPMRPPSPNNTRPVSSNSSVGSVGSAGGGGNLVGTGTTSSAKVYRHGSPAPNTRPAFGRSSNPQPSPRQGPGSNNSVNSNSVTSLGSGMSNIPPNNTNVRSSYVAPTPSRTGQRYSSPLAVPPSGNNATPQRRGSFSSMNSVGSTGSNNPPPSSSAAAEAAKRKQYGTSPMRASYGGNPSSSSSAGNNNLSSSSRPSSTSISSKRFSTPTPQSEQHNSTTANLSSSRALRSSTPTKNTWKF